MPEPSNDFEFSDLGRSNAFELSDLGNSFELADLGKSQSQSESLRAVVPFPGENVRAGMAPPMPTSSTGVEQFAQDYTRRDAENQERAQFTPEQIHRMNEGGLIENAMTAPPGLEAPMASRDDILKKFPTMTEGDADIVAGILRGGAGLWNAALSPVGVASAPFMAGGGAAAKSIMAGVAGGSAYNLPETVADFHQAMQSGDPGRIAEKTVNLGVAAATIFGPLKVLREGEAPGVTGQRMAAAEIAEAKQAGLTKAAMALESMVKEREFSPREIRIGEGGQRIEDAPPPDALDPVTANPQPTALAIDPVAASEETRAADMSVGPGAASPSEFEPVRTSITGIRNAVTDQERANRGLPPVEPIARRGFGAVWDEAMTAIDADPAYQDRLIDELRTKPRALTDTEDAILLQRQVDLQNTLDKAQRELIEAHESEDQGRVAEAFLRFTSFSDQLLDIYNVNRAVGTETGRGLNARRLMANEDFTLAKMVTEKRAARGGVPLTEAELKEIQTLKDKIYQTQKDFDAYREDMEEKLRKSRTDRVVIEITAKGKGEASTPQPDVPILTARIKAAIENKAPLADVGNLVQKLAKAFVRAGITERDPLIDAVHGVLADLIPDLTRRDTMDAISGYGQFRQLSKEAVDVKLRELKGEMQQIGKIEDMEGGIAPKKTGMERRTPSQEERTLIKKVNELKKRLGFVVTDPATQLRSALDSVKTRLKNQIADLEVQIATRTKLIKTKTPVPTDAEAELLKARRDELKQEYDEIFGETELTDAQRIARATKALERSLDEHERMLAEKQPGETFTKTERKTPLITPELEALRARRDGIKELLELFREVDPEAQAKLERTAVNDLFRQIDEYERRIREKDFTPTIKPQLSTPILEALRARRHALSEVLAELRAATPEAQAKTLAKAKTDIQSSIDELVRQINEGDIQSKQQTSGPTDAELEALRSERDDLLKIKQTLRRATEPRRTPEQIALQAYKTRTTNRIAYLQEKIATGDFNQPDRPPTPLDKQALELQAENVRLKNEFRRGVFKDRMANRTTAEVAQDTFVKWRRGFLLSGPNTLAKLFAAAVSRIVSTPVEEAIGGGIGTLIPEVAIRARVEGGFSIKAEAKAVTEAFTTGLKDAWQTLRSGESTLDVLYGKRQLMEPTAIDFFGHLHGALKAPVKRAAFARSFEKLTASDMAKGIDVSDPMVQTRNAMLAYKEAQKAIFLQDNRVVDAYQRSIATLEQPVKETGKPTPGGKAGATLAKTLLPIVRVPVNIVAETLQYATGTVTGSVRLGLAMRQGVETLSEPQANLIMRELKKGSIGGAFLLLGYFNPDMFGGYYQAGQKREPDAVRYGSARVFGLDIPTVLLHNPLLETLQLGATVRRVSDSKLRKKDEEVQGLSSGAWAGALGLTEEVPFVRETMEVAKAFDPRQRGAFLGELSKSIVVPQLFQQIATKGVPFTDGLFGDLDADGQVVKRNPETTLEHIESGIPGLRQELPEKRQIPITKAHKSLKL